MNEDLSDHDIGVAKAILAGEIPYGVRCFECHGGPAVGFGACGGWLIDRPPKLLCSKCLSTWYDNCMRQVHDNEQDLLAIVWGKCGRYTTPHEFLEIWSMGLHY